MNGPDGLDFVALPVADLDRAVAFYRDVLGLRITKDERSQNVDWVEFDVGGNCVGLVRPESFGGQFQPIKFACLALHVTDVEGAIAHLRSKGLPEPHHEDIGVCHMVFIEDTEGNGLVLHHRYAPEPEAT